MGPAPQFQGIGAGLPLEGFTVVMAPPQFARQIKGRPKTDRRDGRRIQRLHKHGLLPAVFQPDEATRALRDCVCQRANLVRLSGQHVQRIRKALELMSLKLTKVLGDVNGVTGLRIIRAILAGQRDPLALAGRAMAGGAVERKQRQGRELDTNGDTARPPAAQRSIASPPHHPRRKFLGRSTITGPTRSGRPRRYPAVFTGLRASSGTPA
jgi:hypothetical protein